MYPALMLIGLWLIYEGIAKITRINARSANDDLYEDARKSRLRHIHQRGDIDLYESNQIVQLGE